MRFDPASGNTAVGSQFTVNVVVDTGGAQVTGTDAYVIFDTSKFQAVSVQNGNFFPSTSSAIQASSIVIRGIVTEPASFRQGSGVLGTITFKALQNGASAMNFYCNIQAGDTSKIIESGIDAPNIINCSANNTLNVTVGSNTNFPTTAVSGSPVSPTVRPTISGMPDGDGKDDDGEDDDGRDDDGKDDDGEDDDGRDDDGKDDDGLDDDGNDGIDDDGRDDDGKDDDGKDDDGLDDDGKDDDGLDDDGIDDDGIPDAKARKPVNLIMVSVIGGALIAAFLAFAARRS